MINFRYHIVSIAAVFLALAVGITLGLVIERADDSPSSTTSSSDTRGASEQAFETAFADASADLVGTRLADRRVLVVTTPDARSSQVDDLVARVGTAGGSVVGEIKLTDKLLDSGGRQFAESIAEESAGDDPGVQAAEDSYSRIGASLARGFVGEADLDEQASTIAAAFSEAGLLDLTQTPTQRADLVLVVVGSGQGDSSRGDMIADITAQLATAGSGAAVVGPSTTSNDGEVLDQVRSSDRAGSFSTVDVTELAAGRLVAVWALVKSAEGENGSWGTTRSADGQLPE